MPWSDIDIGIILKDQKLIPENILSEVFELMSNPL